MASENWCGRVNFGGHSPEWRVLSKFSVQPCGCNLVALIASFICIKSKQWSFSGLEGQFTDTGSQGCTVLSQKTSGSFGAVKKAADTEFAGGYSVILILACVSASLRFRFLT